MESRSLLLRGASLADGTGAPARPADVAVEDGRIAAIGGPGELPPPDGGANEVVDLDGLVLAPGFVDVHTHDDAQILWDGDLTPSSWAVAGGRRRAADRAPAAGLPPRRPGAGGRGLHADLVAFDPDRVGCTPVERVYDQPGGAGRLVVRSTGVERTWVNGVATRSGGEDLPDVAPARLLGRS